MQLECLLSVFFQSILGAMKKLDLSLVDKDMQTSVDWMMQNSTGKDFDYPKVRFLCRTNPE